MHAFFLPLIVAGMAASSLTASPKITQGVPFYTDYWGTGPTAGMMILGYWDAHGYPDLIPGDASAQTRAIDDLIASPGNIADYVDPVDKPGAILPDAYITAGRQPHPDNSLADLMGTSQSAILNPAGYTSESWAWFGVERWMQAHSGPQLNVCYGHMCDTRMDFLNGPAALSEIYARVKASLDRGDPLMAVTAAHGPDTPTDNFVVVVGYRPGNPAKLAYLDPKDRTGGLHWRHFVPAGASDGFYAVMYFEPLTP